MDTNDIHKAVVDRIRSRITHFYTTKTAFRVYHGSTNSTRHANFDRASIVDISTLNSVLSIDPVTKIAVVEPNVSMDALVRETMKVGLLPPVVMEFPGITVGGGFVGTAGESSSFKYGFFDRTVLSAEVVLANGDVVWASSTKNQELFEGLRGSFGTLGVLTCVELQLIDLSSHVEVTYHPTTSSPHAMSKLQDETANASADYVDGILFSRTSGAIITARLSPSPSPTLPLRTFSRPWDPWFYLHARRLASRTSPTTECVPIQDYLFRYDRGAFWMGTYGFAHFHVTFTWLTRLLLDFFMHTRVMYHALHASGHTDRYIIHDIAFPAPNAASFVEYVDKTFGIYPLWLCPVRKDGRSSMGHPRPFSGDVPGKKSGAVYEGEYINVGVWGPYPSSETEYVRANRDIEAKAHALGGLKWLYSRVFYTEDEWWGIYDKERYEALREKFNAGSLPSVWEKVRDRGSKRDFGTGWKAWVKKWVWKSEVLRGCYGVWKAVKGGDYVLSKKGKTE